MHADYFCEWHLHIYDELVSTMVMLDVLTLWIALALENILRSISAIGSANLALTYDELVSTMVMLAVLTFWIATSEFGVR